MGIFKAKREPEGATYWRRQFHEILLDSARREADWVHERKALVDRIEELGGEVTLG